jgi:senataxin
MEKGSKKFENMFDLCYDDSEWQVQKICNLATLHREFQAIHSMPQISFATSILAPKLLPEHPEDFFDIPDNLFKILKEKYNASQFGAIQSSLRKSGVTLIQGPPGTGKTNTILGILSVLLNSKQSVRQKVDDGFKGMSIEDLKRTNSTQDYRKTQFAKSMPWLRSNFNNWRDGDKIDINLPLETHLVYPTADVTKEYTVS